MYVCRTCMTVTQPVRKKKLFNFFELSRDKMTPTAKGDGGSVTQKRRVAPLPDIVHDRKHSSTPITSDTTADLLREDENKSKDEVSTRKHPVLSMVGLTSPVWTLGMFQMVSGESCQCILRTKQTNPCEVGVRHAVCTVPKWHDETHSEGEDSDGREHV